MRLKAIAASEMAAGSVGIDAIKYKVQMFVVSAGDGERGRQPRCALPARHGSQCLWFAYSLNLLTGVIIGGLTSVWGGALGATVITGLRELLRGLSLPLWESVIMGALTVIVLIAFPAGLAGALERIVRPCGRPRRQGRDDLGRP